MDIATIAFLVLLGGTPAEHTIVVDNMDECERAAESVTQYACLSSDEYDAHIRQSARYGDDFQLASGPTAESKRALDIDQSQDTLDTQPSAVKRRVLNALYPQHAISPPPRLRRDSEG